MGSDSIDSAINLISFPAIGRLWETKYSINTLSEQVCVNWVHKEQVRQVGLTKEAQHSMLQLWYS
jgi:hypothetical protein